MLRTVVLCHHKMKREFILSSKTKAYNLKILLKKAFNLHSEIKYFKQQQAKFKLEDLLSPSAPQYGEYEVVMEDESEEDRSRSEVCSQKNMSKVSGRKNPPSEIELLDSKFYIDDFQLFMAEVSSKKSNGLFGIVFFNNKKKASFLGKKILRELIFEFDKIEFFYALHPIKMHTSSALLGDILVFSLFRGKNMIHEREFPEQITAADQILNYIKNLIKIGDINFDKVPVEQRKPKNLIRVHEQRSFDHNIENSPQKLSDFGGKPNRTTELIKTKPVTPDKDIKGRKFVNQKQESPIKSHVTNEISFENDLYQPQWFFEGNALTRLEKGMLSALIKGNDSSLLAFLNGLNLKIASREQLNIKLVKVFLKEVIEDKLGNFSPQQRQFILENQNNRKSFVFTSLLKLYKFGNIQNFVDNLSNGFKTIEKIVQEEKQVKQIEQLRKFSEAEEKRLTQEEEEKEAGMLRYSSIARTNTQKNKGGFTIKLLDCQNDKQDSLSESVSPFRENTKMRLFHIDIASNFHKSPLSHIPSHYLKEIEFSSEYNEAEQAAISDLILKNDAFLIENFVRNPNRGKKLEKMPAKAVKKYLREIESRYDKIRQRTIADPELHAKMQKFQIFHGLVYFLYKQRMINKKQLKISFYLYSWSDLNILAAFEIYLIDRNIEQFVDTIYSIDYNYYLNNLYQINHEEVIQFNIEIESQLIILFLFEKYINSGEERISLEKFIRAGDTSLLELYTNLSITQEELIKKMIEMSKAKKEVLLNLTKIDSYNQIREREKKKDRCDFIDHVMATRFKQCTKKELIQYCINHDEPTIHQMFDKLDEHNNQHQWLQTFGDYLKNLDEIHMNLVIRELAEEAGIQMSRIEESKKDIIKGIYQAYLQTNDKADTIDSLERAVRKTSRSNSPK